MMTERRNSMVGCARDTQASERCSPSHAGQIGSGLPPASPGSVSWTAEAIRRRRKPHGRLGGRFAAISQLSPIIPCQPTAVRRSGTTPLPTRQSRPPGSRWSSCRQDRRVNLIPMTLRLMTPPSPNSGPRHRATGRRRHSDDMQLRQPRHDPDHSQHYAKVLRQLAQRARERSAADARDTHSRG